MPCQLAFMFESRWPFALTEWARGVATLQTDYDACWGGFEKATLPG